MSHSLLGSSACHAMPELSQHPQNYCEAEITEAECTPERTCNGAEADLPRH